MKSRYLILLVAVIIFAVLIVATSLASCAPVGIGSAENNNILLNNVPTKTSPDGIKYKIVTIEGEQFIATQGYDGNWQLAGPLK
jgi:hypothetical protein